MIEARRRGRGARGVKVTKNWRACHLGRNPRRGGRPARERNISAREILDGLDREEREEIFCDERLRE